MEIGHIKDNVRFSIQGVSTASKTPKTFETYFRGRY